MSMAAVLPVGYPHGYRTVAVRSITA